MSSDDFLTEAKSVGTFVLFTVKIFPLIPMEYRASQRTRTYIISRSVSAVESVCFDSLLREETYGDQLKLPSPLAETRWQKQDRCDKRTMPNRVQQYAKPFTYSFVYSYIKN